MLVKPVRPQIHSSHRANFLRILRRAGWETPRDPNVGSASVPHVLAFCQYVSDASVPHVLAFCQYVSDALVSRVARRGVYASSVPALMATESRSQVVVAVPDDVVVVLEVVALVCVIVTGVTVRV
jgi:hypothetical protein